MVKSQKDLTNYTGIWGTIASYDHKCPIYVLFFREVCYNITKVCTICFGFKQPYQGFVEYRASTYHCGLSAKITASQ